MANMSPGALQGRIALVTGASRGIGQAVAIRFAAEGAHVLATGRDVKGLEATDDAIRALGYTATLIPLDLLEIPKIENLAQQTAARFGKLDIVVGNAGQLGELTPVSYIAPDRWEQVMKVNLDANFHLIRCLDPLLKASDAGRAMFVTSGVTESPHAYWGAYSVSKAALEALVLTYAAENQKSALRVNLINPGGVRTKMRASAFPGEDPATLPPPEKVTDIFVKLALPDFKETGKKFHAR